MFDNLLMSMNSKLKKIMSGLEMNEGKIDEISTDVGSVGTSVATVQSTSDEIKALIGTEIATQLSALEANVIAAMNNGSSGLTSCIRKIQRGVASLGTNTTTQNSVSVTLSGFTDLSKMVVILNGGSGSGDFYGDAIFTTLSLTKLTITSTVSKANTWYNIHQSYQVIEFY